MSTRLGISNEERLLHFVQDISARATLSDIIRCIIHRVTTDFGLERVSLVLLQKSGEVAYMVNAAADGKLENIILKLEKYPELQEIVRTGLPLVVDDVFEHQLFDGVRETIKKAERIARSAVLFPLRHRDRVVGALFLRSETPRPSLDTDAMLQGQLIASITAVAVGHALEQELLHSEQRALLRTKASVDEEMAELKRVFHYIDYANDAIAVCDSKGTILFGNDALEGILDSDKEALRGKSLFEHFDAENAGRLGRAMDGAAAAVSNAYVDLSPQTAPGAVLSASVRRLNEPKGIVVSFRDVTGMRAVENELQQNKEFLETLIQSSADAMVAASVDGTVMLFNRAAENCLGFSADELLGRRAIDTVFPNEIWEEMRGRIVSESYGGLGRLVGFRAELVDAQGAPLPVNLSAARVELQGETAAFLAIFQDLREKERLAERLNKVEAQLQLTERQAVAVELAGAAAHELNQPLTSILGYASILKRLLSQEDSEQNKRLEMVAQEARRMATIVRRLGDITQYKSKRYVGTSRIMDFDGEVSRVGPKEDAQK